MKSFKEFAETNDHSLEGKPYSGSWLNRMKRTGPGPQNPDDNLHVPGYGVIRREQVKNKVVDYAKELAKSLEENEDLRADQQFQFLTSLYKTYQNTRYS